MLNANWPQIPFPNTIWLPPARVGAAVPPPSPWLALAASLSEMRSLYAGLTLFYRKVPPSRVSFTRLLKRVSSTHLLSLLSSSLPCSSPFLFSDLTYALVFFGYLQVFCRDCNQLPLG